MREFIDAYEVVFVVEQNRDAQLRTLLTLDLDVDPARLVSVLHYDGMPITAADIVEPVARHLREGRAA